MDAVEKKKMFGSKRFTKLENYDISTKIVCKCESGHFSWSRVFLSYQFTVTMYEFGNFDSE